MRLFFSALMLTFMLLNELEASDNSKKNLFFGKLNFKKDRKKIDSYGSPRLTKPSSSKQHSTSRQQEALDLHIPAIPDIQESTQEPYSQRIFALKNKMKMRHDPFPSSSTSRMIPNNPTQQDGLNINQNYRPAENIHWLIQHFRQGNPYAPGGSGWQNSTPGTSESVELIARQLEAERMFALPFREHSQLIQKGLNKDRQRAGGRVEYRDDDSYRHYQSHYPRGLPDSLPPPFSSADNIDQSKSQSGNQKKMKNKRKGVIKRDI